HTADDVLDGGGAFGRGALGVLGGAGRRLGGVTDALDVLGGLLDQRLGGLHFAGLGGGAFGHPVRGGRDQADRLIGLLDLPAYAGHQGLQRLEQAVEGIGDVAERAARYLGANREVAFRGVGDHAEELHDRGLEVAVIVLDVVLE